MGQVDVYEWLKDQFESGKTDWFTVQDITKGLRDKGLTEGALDGVRTDCIKLAVARCIEIKDLDKTGLSNYKRVFKYGK